MSTEKKNFFLKLNPPRTSFMMDMTTEEKSVMQKHVAYWVPYVADGTVIVLGPVMDPKGGYGIAVVRVDNDEHLQQLLANDPANEMNSYEYIPNAGSYQAISTSIALEFRTSIQVCSFSKLL